MMSIIFIAMVALSVVFSLINGNSAVLGAAVQQGAASGITLTLSLAGSICLWSGVGRLTEKAGFTEKLSRLLRPLLSRLFPSIRGDKALEHSLCGNICANLLGLGNAATPMGIRAARRLAARRTDGVASDELCRLVVLNTASIQLIPANVAALRVSLGCGTPFDILPAVWITGFCSAGVGLLAARVMQRW